MTGYHISVYTVFTVYASLSSIVHIAESLTFKDSLLQLSEIDWSSEQSGVYIGSPSVCQLVNGSLLASHDEFGPKSVRC